METLHHNYKMFMFFNRKFKMTEAKPPFDVAEAFSVFTDKGSYMNAAQLRRFLVEFQAEDETAMTETAAARVHHDMNAPLQHYFIYTGHNSYLTGNQLSSDCSDVPIIKALERGVRVIELDIWPNSAKDDINVLHGRTLTTPVPLVKCLKSIKDNAFAASPYPLIITLEDHLTPDLQAKTAKALIEVFGEMLYTPESNHTEEFPSPEELKYRIIISTKPPKEYLESKERKDKEDTSAGSSGDERHSNRMTPDGSDSDESSYGKSPDHQVAAPEYKRLIAIHAGKPKDGLGVALKSGLNKFRRLSLSEHELEKAATTYGVDLVRFTQKYFLRIYPKGTRIRSSNYNPLVAWYHGAQMVAFNMQGYGKSLWLMHGMYRANGGCGYIKKPDYLLKKGPNGEVFDPEATLRVKTTLKFRLIGVPADYAKKKTKVIEDDWVPVWEEELEFPLTVPELALLQIEIREYDMHEKDDFGGQTCLPVCELKPGIRSIPLFDKKGEKYPSARLLIKFQFA
ncbi:hypothetical protein KSS87_004924 [Heliosperma pusillum]|nr:hypothetical protein KSS87_004924 [Heliosperma pusillum]